MENQSQIIKRRKAESRGKQQLLRQLNNKHGNQAYYMQKGLWFSSDSDSDSDESLPGKADSNSPMLNQIRKACKNIKRSVHKQQFGVQQTKANTNIDQEKPQPFQDEIKCLICFNNREEICKRDQVQKAEFIGCLDCLFLCCNKCFQEMRQTQGNLKQCSICRRDNSNVSYSQLKLCGENTLKFQRLLQNEDIESPSRVDTQCHNVPLSAAQLGSSGTYSAAVLQLPKEILTNATPKRKQKSKKKKRAKPIEQSERQDIMDTESVIHVDNVDQEIWDRRRQKRILDRLAMIESHTIILRKDIEELYHSVDNRTLTNEGIELNLFQNSLVNKNHRKLKQSKKVIGQGRHNYIAK